MAAESDKRRFARGRREMRDITIETYSSVTGEARPSGLIPGSDSRVSSALPLTAAEGNQLGSVMGKDPGFQIPPHSKVENYLDECVTRHYRATVC